MMITATAGLCLLATASTATAEHATSSTSSVEQLGITYGTQLEDMVVTFASFAAFDDAATCVYGSSSDDLSLIAPATATSYTYLKYTSPFLYSATLTGLPTGNKDFFYSCGSEQLGYSDVQAFKTHPGVGVDDVTFFVLGDVGQTANSVNTINELVQYEDLLASSSSLSGGIISMGDLSYANGKQPLWDSFGNLRQTAAAKIPFQTTLGNHEWFDTAHVFTAYKARFQNPPVAGAKELYYSFNVGLVHFVMVAGYCEEMKSTLEQPCLAEGSAQRAWLVGDLQGVDRSTTPWVVVSFHQPFVNSNTAHPITSEGYPMQAAIEDILYENKVDLVFSGHVHAYERSCQLYNFKCTVGAPSYITIGDGGNKEGLASGWLEPQPAWSVFRQASYGFGELRVSNATHMHWSWHQNEDLVPTIADEVTLVKGGSFSHHALRSVAPVGTAGVTGASVFADSARGAAAKEFNAAALKEVAMLH